MGSERWIRDSNNLRLDAGELGPVPAFARGLFPSFDQNAVRPYSDEINVGIEHQLIQNLAVGVSYHRRQHRDGLGLIDTARPASASRNTGAASSLFRKAVTSSPREGVPVRISAGAR